jgi:Putative silver efflux pump
MIEAIIDWSIRQRTLVLLATCLLVLGGIWAAWKTPVDGIHELSDVQVIVKTKHPDQAKQLVEDQITNPLSKAML